MNLSYIYFIIFFCLGYLIVTDSSIAALFILCGKWMKFQYEKYKWIVMYHPKTPWARYSMHRRSMKIAEELMKELAEKNKE